MNKEFSFTDRVTTVTLLSLGLIIGIRGLYWSINQQDVILESDFYEALHQVLPIYVWGVLLLAFGVSLI